MKECSITRTMFFLSKKWTLVILKELSEGKKSFLELSNNLNGISTRTLTVRLKELEKEGIIDSKRLMQTPPKTEYYLTKKGKDLIKCFKYLVKWTKKYKV